MISNQVYGVMERRSACASIQARAAAFFRKRWMMTVVSAIPIVIRRLSSDARSPGGAVDVPTLLHREYQYVPNQSDQADPARQQLQLPTYLMWRSCPMADRLTFHSQPMKRPAQLA